MKTITISTENSETYSSISNFFIDYYMTEANGEFVKVYLYLVRLLNRGRDISVAEIADHFNLTENDICRAIKYWVGKDVIKFSYDGSGNLSGLVLLPLKAPSDFKKKDNDAIELLKENAAKSAPAAVLDSMPVETSVPAKPAFTRAIADKLANDSDWADLVYHTETVFNLGAISQSESESLSYIYTELGFNVDLLDYLIDYCASMGKKSLRYMEAVAIAWYKDGIRTKEQAKEQNNATSAISRIVFKALGIKRPSPTTVENTYFTSWTKDLGFDEKMIQIACDKAITNRPSSANYSYINGILENWHKNGIKTPEDVYKNDKAFMSKAKATTYGNSNVSSFSNFKQTKLDSQLDEMEALFLKEVNS